MTDTLNESWGYTGGVLLIFGGFLGAVVAAGGLAGDLPNQDTAALRPEYWLGLAAAVVAFVGGTQLAARHPYGGLGGPFLLVFIPVPGLLGLLVSRVGRHLRTAPSAGVTRAALAGVGVYLLVMAAQWLAAGYHLPGVEHDFRSVGWAIALELGLSAVLLAITPGGPAEEPVALEAAG